MICKYFFPVFNSSFHFLNLSFTDKLNYYFDENAVYRCSSFMNYAFNVISKESFLNGGAFLKDISAISEMPVYPLPSSSVKNHCCLEQVMVGVCECVCVLCVSYFCGASVGRRAGNPDVVRWSLQKEDQVLKEIVAHNSLPRTF